MKAQDEPRSPTDLLVRLFEHAGRRGLTFAEAWGIYREGPWPVADFEPAFRRLIGQGAVYEFNPTTGRYRLTKTNLPGTLKD